MGKWTPNYVEDILHSKISSLVSGAIRRASVEKEPSITYENFVNELDSGDSFTTSIIDILVKEIADRHTRPYHDRKFLAERTIRTLRQLSSHARSYPGRMSGRSHSRRAVNLTEYFTASPNELEMDDDDDEYVEPVSLPGGSDSESARLNAMHAEFHASVWPPAPTRRITASPSPVSDEWPLPPASWAAPASSSSTVAPANLSRQPSIRRAAPRTRLVDFNDYTARRRTTTRDTLSSRPDVVETVTEPREGLSSQTVRRFFPFPRSRRHQTSTNPAWSEFSDTMSPDSDEPMQYFIEPSVGTWYDYDPPEPRLSPEAESREETENLLRAPRLRRGGIRPPESMLSRHASPITIVTPATESTTPAPATVPQNESSSTPAPEEPVAYPTPGSSENDNLA
ncbi:hypothetical protein CVT25_003375 [Psilocybe cyanescens]|uniref:Uncharacterized protein n=1 Tax=Psilocybe cyanescens TaxID=93625 RepID=A0A409WLQ7_PSICY|nr:hypothetical protein CVT25_003375 [Psilocybe cyanescens]